MGNNVNSLDLDNTFKNLVHDTAARNRLVRPLLKLYGRQKNDADSPVSHISGYRIKTDVNTPGAPLSIEHTECLVPIIISRYFRLGQKVLQDPDALEGVATKAVADVAQAEDAILLLGKGAKEYIKQLHIKVEDEELAQQIGLWEVASGERTTPSKSGNDKSLLDRITHGRLALEKNGHIGNYAVFVSQDLDAKLDDKDKDRIIRLVVNGGYNSSPCLPENSGVMLSLSSGSIKIAVPKDITIVPDKSDSSFSYFRVNEQIRLVLDMPEAIVAL